MGAASGLDAAISQSKVSIDGWRQLVDVWWGKRPSVGYIGNLALLVAVYYAAAHLGYALGFSGPVAAIVWLPVGVGIAFLYLRGLRFWPGVVLADLLVNNYSALPFGSALGQSFGNLAEVLVGASLLRLLCPRRDPLATLSGVTGMVAAIAAGTFLSAVIGPLSGWLGDAISTSSLPHVWWTWWLGDFSGALIVVPLALSWSRPVPWPWRPAVVLEAGLTMVAVAGVSAVALASGHPIRSLAFPALIWAALRFGSRGATLAITIMSGIAIWGVVHFTGAFEIESVGSRVLDTQLFIAAVSLSALVTAALVSERERLTESVRQSRARLVEASDRERRKLERDLHDGAQQRLMAVQIKLRVAEEQTDDPSLQRKLDAVGVEAAEAVEELRTLAHGIYPLVLRSGGLVRALRSLAMRAPIPVSVIDEGIGRCSPSVEAAIYFCSAEAVQNAVKHAGSHVSAVVTLGRDHDRINFAISDDGVGIAQSASARGDGLMGMRDRVGAAGGELEVVSSPGKGTTVRGTIPDPGGEAETYRPAGVSVPRTR